MNAPHSPEFAAAESTIPAWLARTKLQPPALRADVIARPRLLAALADAVPAHRLTLVSAPAGYGKTTLLASLPLVSPVLPVAWLALDDEDNDPVRFLAALIAALRVRDQAYGAGAAALLANLPDPGAGARRVVGVLVNDLLAALPGPTALVLDDLHAVSAPVPYVALDYLLERLPPDLHLVIATRHDPPIALARLRARRQMAELRLADLRFTEEEARRFLAESLGLALAPPQLRTLHARTEGWAAGMSLLGSALDHPAPAGDHDAIIAGLAGTDRFVFDFLAEEVLRVQDPATRAFLLDTAVLAELTPAACSAVTGRDDSAAILEGLYRRNLFVLPFDAAGGIFRYHDLFRDFLRGQLSRERPAGAVRELHRRAAAAEQAPARVIGHLLAAEDWAAAAHAIEAAGEGTLEEGALETLRGWIEALPPDVREAHPCLTYFQGLGALDRWRISEARALFAQALDAFTATGDRVGQGEALVHLAACLTAMGDFAAAWAAHARARDLPVPPRSRVQQLLGHASQALAEGDTGAVIEALDAALDAVEASPGPRACQVLAAHFQSYFLPLPGATERTERAARLLAAGDGAGAGLGGIAGDRLAALAGWWRGTWDEALAAGDRALARSAEFGGFATIDFGVNVILAAIRAVRGDGAGADAHLDTVLAILASPAWAGLSSAWAPIGFYMPARVHLLRGRPVATRALAERMRTLEGPHAWAGAKVARLLLHGLLALDGGDPRGAEEALRTAIVEQRRLPHTRIYGDATLFLACAHLDAGRPAEALAGLAPLLMSHEREGTPGAILREGALVTPLLRLAVERGVQAPFAAGLLARLGDPAPTPAPPADPAAVYLPATGETLSPREVEVLRLLATGVNNPAIADQLFISVYTVKNHVAHILAKLQVASRIQAAARARDLGLV